ncbi:MAG TPA: phospholipase [Turneriella sp.]|nr:phospholipase [Turneriella sp.]
MLRLVLCLLSVLCISPSLYAWSNHFLFYHAALEVLPEVANTPKIKVESLEDFLLKEQKGLVEEMAKMENEVKTTYAKYAPQPEALAFKGGDKKTIRENFLRALRVNPKTPFGFFLQELPGNKLPGAAANSLSASMFGDKDIKDKYALYDIRNGQSVDALEVLATAGDEPDFGMDINLFVDNEGPLGKDYGFGTQSFGNPKLYFGTQAPFHIGYYHESWIIFKAGSFLKRTYPKYRVHQYLTLARFAFKTGHPYWGYRFLGWGLHYIGDLTQPYHARVLPNNSTLRMLWINIKAMLGFEASKIAAIEDVSDRHLTLERYHFSVLRDAYVKHNLNHPFIQSVKVTQKDAGYGAYNADYIENVLTQESYGISDELDTLIDKSNLLKGFVDGKVTAEVNAPALKELDALIATHMQGIGAHVRNYVRAGIMK